MYPLIAPERASTPNFASQTALVAPNLYASNLSVLIVTNLASVLKSDFEAVVKSEKRVPIPIITSASLAIRFAERLPVTPTPPTLSG